jgi:peptidoglycan DL-endopeptidase CwlO
MTKITALITAGLLVVATSASALAASTTAATTPTTTAAAPMAQSGPAPKAVHHASMSRERVEKIQAALNNNGESLAVDGVWGSKTRAAVKDFQQKHGLKPTGHVDSATLDQLKVPPKA